MLLFQNDPTRDEALAFLNLRILPARLESRGAAVVLSFEQYQIGILVSAGILVPLGHPARNGPKWFAVSYILTLRDDKNWLHKATLFLQRHNKEINAKRLKKSVRKQV
jgi:hypothetical protein